MLHFEMKNEPNLGSLDEKINPTHTDPTHITEEELKVYKKCCNRSIIVAGIPFAFISEAFSSFLQRKSEAQPIDNPSLAKSYAKKGVRFCANVILGSFLYLPVCYQKLKDFRRANSQTRVDTPQTPTVQELSSPKTQLEDFSYPTDLMTNIGESERSFSADFNSTQLILEDEVKPSIPQTTYDDLRLRNRERLAKGTGRSPQPTDSSQRLNTPPQPILSDPPPRPVKKNKYGDEME